MITLTLSAGQIFYFGSCFGVMLAGLAMLVAYYLIAAIRYFCRRPSGAHSVGIRRDGRPDRYIHCFAAARYAGRIP